MDWLSSSVYDEAYEVPAASGRTELAELLSHRTAGPLKHATVDLSGLECQNTLGTIVAT